MRAARAPYSGAARRVQSSANAAIAPPSAPSPRVRASRRCRDARSRRAARARNRGPAVAHDVADQQRDVDGEVPREHAEHRRREDVDALRAADAVEREAERRTRSATIADADPGPPRSARNALRSGGSRAPRRSSASPARRATNASGARACADDLGRGAARPRAIRVAPERARGVGGLDRAHGDHLHGGGFVHAGAILRGATAAGMIAPSGPHPR